MNKKKIKCSVIGPKGYTGIELIKLLMAHPFVDIQYLVTQDKKKEKLTRYIPQLPVDCPIEVGPYSIQKVAKESDVVFLALPHRMSMEYAAPLLDAKAIVIDLSADFRFSKLSTYEKYYDIKHTAGKLLKKAVYGISELNREKIEKADLIACPGCYPTSAILAIAPLIKAGLVKPDTIMIDSKSGVSGAGKKPSSSNHFGEIKESFKAYKVNQHQHAPEIEESLTQVTGKKAHVVFVPHLLPIFRGILSTIYLDLLPYKTHQQVLDAYHEAYDEAPFVRLKGDNQFPQISDVALTNFCDIGWHVDRKRKKVIVVSAIDNLLKGASGQAVQNMNIRLGFPDTTGF